VATWLFKVYRFALTTRLALGIEVGLQDFQLQVFQSATIILGIHWHMQYSETVV
jgi:hypothetical protein